MLCNCIDRYLFVFVTFSWLFFLVQLFLSIKDSLQQKVLFPPNTHIWPAAQWDATNTHTPVWKGTQAKINNIAPEAILAALDYLTNLETWHTTLSTFIGMSYQCDWIHCSHQTIDSQFYCL